MIAAALKTMAIGRLMLGGLSLASPEGAARPGFS